MDINYFGLLRLAQEFGPALKGRSADGATHAAAWVNLLSVYALSNYPAARHLLGVEGGGPLARAVPARRDAADRHPRDQCLPGPDRRRVEPEPAAAEGRAGGAGERDRQGAEGRIEDVYPGDVAQEWLERWRENPKVLERELAAGG